VNGIFISYRRDDAAPYAGRLCDRLSSAFGADRVFMDVEDIAPGTDFTQAIDQTVGKCDVLVAVMGPRWLELLRARSGTRDFVAEEIAAALRRGVTVIPALVGGAGMPGENDLPPELASLARRQAIVLRDAEFRQNSGELVRAIRSATAGGRSSKRLAWLLVAIGIVIAILGSAVFLFNSRQRASLNGIWIARMQSPGGRPYNVRLELQSSDGTLTGQVRYPTGDAAIQDGKLAAKKLTFFTRHTPQFESEPATIRFRGTVRGREIDLTALLPDGRSAAGIARKTD
jgi:hypothetical protein